MTTILTNAAFGIVAIALALWFLDWLFGRLFDAVWPDEKAEQERARRELEARLAAANKQVTNRPRLRAVRFWNF